MIYKKPYYNYFKIHVFALRNLFRTYSPIPRNNYYDY